MLLLKALSLSLFSRRALARRAESPSRCGAERLIARLRARRIATRSSVLSIACHSARAASSSPRPRGSQQCAMAAVWGRRAFGRGLGPQARWGRPFGAAGTGTRRCNAGKNPEAVGPETWSPLPACGACGGGGFFPPHPSRPSPDCLASEPSERRARARCSACTRAPRWPAHVNINARERREEPGDG